MVTIPQAAALPTRDGKVCLVTSRSRRRWVIPKGWIDPGHTPSQAAVTEAWEEAGLVGTLHPEPVGSYQYGKDGREHHVTVYVLRVIEEKTTWPERELRTRVWLSPAEAAERVDEPGLRQIILQLLPATDPFAPAASGSAAD
jgi:8-oxo-dGTP pyrophosphatase MutT (NUDIX family)